MLIIQMNTGILKNNYFAVNFGRNDSILFWKVGSYVVLFI